MIESMRIFRVKNHSGIYDLLSETILKAYIPRQFCKVRIIFYKKSGIPEYLVVSMEYPVESMASTHNPDKSKKSRRQYLTAS